MNKVDIAKLVKKYALEEGIESSYDQWAHRGDSQYDDDSADINYSLVRHFKPTRVVEFGARTGRCTHDILLALLRNKLPFVFKSYELEDGMRIITQKNIDEDFGEGVITIGGDVTKATDIPDALDYVFIDNYHDMATTQWVFDVLLPRCKPGALIHFHDLRIKGDWKEDPGGFPDEIKLVISKAKKNGGPLEKLYWSWDNGGRWESAWFLYNP